MLCQLFLPHCLAHSFFGSPSPKLKIITISYYSNYSICLATKQPFSNQSHRSLFTSSAGRHSHYPIPSKPRNKHNSQFYTKYPRRAPPSAHHLYFCLSVCLPVLLTWLYSLTHTHTHHQALFYLCSSCLQKINAEKVTGFLS